MWEIVWKNESDSYRLVKHAESNNFHVTYQYRLLRKNSDVFRTDFWEQCNEWDHLTFALAECAEELAKERNTP